MALFNALLRYKEEGRIVSFDMVSDKKAQVRTSKGRIVVFMSSEYINGEAEIAEAAQDPTASALVYNTWDKISKSAAIEARRNGIEVYTFGAFGHWLDGHNAGS